MAALLFVGAALVAFGPPLALFWILVARKAQLVIVFVASAFAWLIAAILAGLFWLIPPVQTSPAATVLLSVLAQELVRYGLVRFYLRAEKAVKGMLRSPTSVLPLSDPSSALAAGLGFGMMASVVQYGAVLAQAAAGPGSYFTANCTHMSMYLVSAFTALFFTVAHACLMLCAFDAARRRAPARWAGVVALHAGASALTLLNAPDGPGCAASLPLLFALVCGAVGATWAVLRSPTYHYWIRVGKDREARAAATGSSDGGAPGSGGGAERRRREREAARNAATAAATASNERLSPQSKAAQTAAGGGSRYKPPTVPSTASSGEAVELSQVCALAET